MANTIDAYIPELWANESVMILLEKMVIANLVHRDFSNEIAKFGDIVHTRKPAEFKAKRKVNADEVTVQDASADDIQVPLNQHFHTSFRILDGEETKSFKQLRDEYLEPAVDSISREIDLVLLGLSHEFNVNSEGEAQGITSTNIKEAIINTRKRMNINKAHDQNRNLILSPDTEAEALKLDLFVSADKLGDEGTAMREASLGRKLQFDTWMAQNTPSYSTLVNNASQPLVDLAAGYQVGDTVIHVDTAGSALVVGQYITIADEGVPHLVTALGSLATEDIDVTFTPGLRKVVADDAVVTISAQALVDEAAGYANGYGKELTINGYTGIIPVGAGVKLATAGTPNVLLDGVYSVIATTETATDTTGLTLNRPLLTPVVNDDVIFFTPNANYNFAFHRNAITMVTRPLAAAPRGLALSSVASANGVGIRVTITYSGEKQGVLVTVDVLMGVQVLDRDLGAILIG